jgi:hypothetical protein
MHANKLPILEPNLQVSFYYRLQIIKEKYLFNSLKRTISDSDINKLDEELRTYADKESISKLASFGLRGEIFFPVPYLLIKNPYLLGYYRLLYGFSQKEFYNKGPFGRYKRIEEKGEIRSPLMVEIEELCMSLSGSAKILVDSLDDLSLSIAHDLQLLTLGPLLRGSENTRIGQNATKDTFDTIKNIVKKYTKQQTKKTILIKNESNRSVLIEFAADPDICITEKLPSRTRPLVSIEIKGGTDASNIHNRLGEAEKSHQKAKGNGFFEFWTIIRVDVDPELAQKESPTTSHFFHLEKIRTPGTKEHQGFVELLGSILGIKTS